MKLKHTGARRIPAVCVRRVAALSLSIVLAASSALAVPTAALAAETDELSSDLDAAKSQLADLTRQLELAQATVATTEAELAATQDEIDALETRIADTREQLAGAQEELSQQVSESYKTGDVSILSLLFSSGSFEELASRLYYANKVAEAESARIESVRTLQQDLNEQQDALTEEQDQLQALLDQQVSGQQDLVSSQAEAESYVNGLSSELQSALDAERAALVEQSRDNQQQAATGGTGNGGTSDDGGANTGGAVDNGEGTNGGGTPSTPSNPAPPANTGGGTGNLSQAARDTIVSVANSQLGCAYGWGAMSPGVAFDCSGLTTYAYSCAGIGLGRTAQAQYNQVVAAGNLKTDPSQFVAGDLVFWGSPGSIYHVAIYIGGGMVTHASDYSTGVITTSVTYGGYPTGGGSPI